MKRRIPAPPPRTRPAGSATPCKSRGMAFGAACPSSHVFFGHPRARRTSAPARWARPACSGPCCCPCRGLLYFSPLGYHRPRRTRLSARARPQSRGTPKDGLPCDRSRAYAKRARPPGSGGARLRWGDDGRAKAARHDSGDHEGNNDSSRGRDMATALVGDDGRAREAGQEANGHEEINDHPRGTCNARKRSRPKRTDEGAPHAGHEGGKRSDVFREHARGPGRGPRLGGGKVGKGAAGRGGAAPTRVRRWWRCLGRSRCTWCSGRSGRRCAPARGRAW